MKIKKSTILKLVVVTCIPLVLSGCLDEVFNKGETYFKGAKVEFKPLTRTSTLATDSTLTYGVRAQLIGEQRNEPLQLGVAVVDSLTTAEQGVQYSLSQSSVTIPADSSFALYPITISGEGLAAGETVTLGVRLQGASGVEAAENLDTHVVTIQGGG